MTHASSITFVSHTNKPGGGELALRRYLEVTDLPVRLVTLEVGGVWEGLEREVVHARGFHGLRLALHGDGLVVANSMRAAFLTSLVLPRSGRLVYWVRDGLTDSAMSRLSLSLTKLVTARRAAHYLANSEWTARTVQQALQVEADRVSVAHSMCGVRAAALGPPRVRPHTPLRLLYLGRIASWKAPDVAVRALSELHKAGVQATLTIAGGAHFGEDAYARELKLLIDEQPGVRMLGHTEDVLSLLRVHDVLVHCSIVPEPFGQVIVQGLASGMPVVATSHGGPVEILREAPIGLLYPPGDIAALALSVREALSSYQAVSSWGSGRAASFDDGALREHTDRLLCELGAPRVVGGTES